MDKLEKEVLKAAAMGAVFALVSEFFRELLARSHPTSGACECPPCVELRRRVVSDGPAPMIAKEGN